MARVFWYILIVLRIVLLVVAAGALAVCVHIFGIPGLGGSGMDVAQRRNSLRLQVTGQRTENIYLEAFQKQESEYLRRIELLHDQIETLHTILPEQPAIEQFTRTMSEVGTRAGVRIRNSAALPQKSRDFYVELPFEVKVEGNYRSLTKFFDQMLRQPRFSNISKALLQPVAGSRIAGDILRTHQPVSATCLMTVYAMRPHY